MFQSRSRPPKPEAAKGPEGQPRFAPRRLALSEVDLSERAREDAAATALADEMARDLKDGFDESVAQELGRSREPERALDEALDRDADALERGLPVEPTRHARTKAASTKAASTKAASRPAPVPGPTLSPPEPAPPPSRPAAPPAPPRQETSMSEPRRRISETNRGLRMILVASVLIVLISWGATLGLQYIRYMQVQTLVATDQDALRVMCAVEPPTETQFGWMHICETVAGVDGDRRNALRGSRSADAGAQ